MPRPANVEYKVFATFMDTYYKTNKDLPTYKDLLKEFHCSASTICKYRQKYVQGMPKEPLPSNMGDRLDTMVHLAVQSFHEELLEVFAVREQEAQDACDEKVAAAEAALKEADAEIVVLREQVERGQKQLKAANEAITKRDRENRKLSVDKAELKGERDRAVERVAEDAEAHATAISRLKETHASENQAWVTTTHTLEEQLQLVEQTLKTLRADFNTQEQDLEQKNQLLLYRTRKLKQSEEAKDAALLRIGQLEAVEETHAQVAQELTETKESLLNSRREVRNLKQKVKDKNARIEELDREANHTMRDLTDAIAQLRMGQSGA